MWQDLLGTSNVSELGRDLRFLDSITYGYPALHTILDENPLFISGHSYGQNGFDCLFCCSTGTAAGEAIILPFLKSIAGAGQLSELGYEGTTIYCLKRQGWKDFYCAFNKNIAVASLQLNLVQQSLRQLDKKISLLDNRYFTKVLNTCDHLAMANLFLNYQEINNTVAPFASKQFRFELNSLNNFAEWTELDLTFSPNEIIMNGFTDADTLGGQYLQLINGQPVRSPAIASVLPANTALLYSFELGDFRTYMKKYKQYLDAQRKLYKRNEWIDETDKKYSMNIENYFYKWIGNEMALVVTEPSDSSLQNDIYAVVATNDTREAISALDSVAGLTSSADNSKSPFRQEFMKHIIQQINIEGILPNMLGETFRQLKQCYYTWSGNYVIFANTPNALESFITRTDGGNTLAKDPYYQSFIKEHISDESAIFIYNNIALSGSLYEQELNDDYAAAVKEHANITKNFQALALQFAPMQGMYYTNGYLKRNPQYKKQAGALWQASLDTTLANAPCWVTDFRTKNKFVIVQDLFDNVYLISNTGQIQWKHKVDGRMLSEAEDVDALGNGKIQFIFNTRENICGLDRNGKNLRGFPVKLSSPATGAISIFDYDHDNKYRIIVCSEDKKIHEYDINGDQVKEWAKPETDDIVSCPVKHISIGDKDYIVTVDKSGNVTGYNRKGELRIRFSHKLPPNIPDFYCTGFSDLQNTYLWAADSTGMVYRLAFTDELTTEKYLSGSYRHISFAVTDLNGNGGTDLLFLAPEELFAYKINKSQIFRFSSSDTLSRKLFTFVFPDNKVRLGALEPLHNKIFMWDGKGNVCSAFPLFGSMGFSIADMNNDGENYLVAGSPDNIIYVYSLP